MADCYYVDGARKQQGPVPADEIARLIRSGAIRRDTLIWYAGMPEWTPAGQVRDFASWFAPTPPPSHPSGQRTGPNDGSYQSQVGPDQATPYYAAKPMGFGGAIKTCFRKYAVFRGRARRPEYWWWTLFNLLLSLGLTLVDLAIAGVNGPE